MRNPASALERVDFAFLPSQTDNRTQTATEAADQGTEVVMDVLSKLVENLPDDAFVDLPEAVAAPWAGLEPYVDELMHVHGCDCGNCYMPEEPDNPEASDGGAGAVAPVATDTADDPEVVGEETVSAPAQLGDMADYLVSGYWTRNGSTVDMRFHNVTDTGIDPNNGVLLYNLSGYSVDGDGVSAERAALIRDVFDVFEATLGIDFQETTSTDTGAVDFFFTDNASGAFASTGYYSNGEQTYSRINIAESWSGGTSTYDDYTLQTIFHEIGHALGLGHQGGYNGAATYGTDNNFENDSWQASMMSYFSQTENTSITASYEFLQTPMSVDWMALDEIYGGQGYGVSNAFTENTTWGFNTTITSDVSNIWAEFSNYAHRTASTIVDGGGIDTLDLSGYSNNTVINLAPSSRTDTSPSVSDIGGRIGNLSIAEGTIIENAIGGAGAETFYGNDADNTMTGNGGNDTFVDSAGSDTYYGDAGTDTVTFGGSYGSYSFEVVGSFLRVIDVAIDLVNITVEWLDFSDGTYGWQQIADSLGSNTAPDAVADATSVAEDGTVSGNVLSNDTDADSDTLTVVSVNGQSASVGQQITLSSGALLTLNANGTFDYDPNGAFESLNDGQSDTDSFSYGISDGQGGTDSATVTITINGVTPPPPPNTAPDAVADAASVAEDGTVSGNVLSNDTDADDDPLAVVSVNGQSASVGQQITLSSGALLTLNANGTFDYDPNGAFESLNDGQSDTDSFSYGISDGQGGTDSATVTITINGVTPPPPPNEAPVANGDTATVAEDVVLSGLNVLGNDSDPENDALTVTRINGVAVTAGEFVTLASGARVTLNADGTLDFDQRGSYDALDVGETAVESFTYGVSDGQNLSIGSVNITINGAFDNAAPVAANDSGSVLESETLAGNVLDNDTDANSDPLVVTAVNGDAASVGQVITLASGALLTLNSDGSYDYDPNGAFDTLNTGQNDTDSFTYAISDGQGGTDTATVTITIDGYSVPVTETPLLIDFETAPLGAFAGDDGIDVSGLSVRAGTILGGERFGESEGFTLLATDQDFDLNSISLMAAAGRVRVNVEAYDDGVLVGTQTLNTRSNRTTDVNFGVSFDSIDEVRFVSSGQFYVDDLGLVSRVADDPGGNVGPTALDDVIQTDEGLSASINLLDNDSDSDGGTLSLVSVAGNSTGTVTLASGATVTFSSDGSVTYDPNGQFDSLYAGQTAQDMFVYEIDDGQGGAAEAVARVTINGTGTPPPEPTAYTIGFEGIASGGRYEEDGFIFSDIGMTNQSVGVSSGASAGQSLDDTISIVGFDGDSFDFESAVVTGMAGRRVTFDVQGYLDGVLVATESFRIRDNRETTLSFDDASFDAVDQVVLTATGGFIIDDLVLVG